MIAGLTSVIGHKQYSPFHSKKQTKDRRYFQNILTTITFFEKYFKEKCSCKTSDNSSLNIVQIGSLIGH